MAVDYEDLFGFIGKWIKPVNNAVSYYSTITTDETALTSGNAYGDGTDYDVHTYQVKPVMDALRSSISSFCSSAASQVEQILKNREGVIKQLGLGNNTNFLDIVNALFNDMVANSESTAASAVTIGAITRTVTNAAAGYAYADKGLDGVTPPIANGPSLDFYLGVDSQLAAASDNITITCIQDSDSLSGSPGSEQWRIEGEPSSNAAFGWLSEGSGTGPTFTTLSRRNNLITNGDFETWTGTNVLGSWTYATGAATTNWVQETSTVYIGDSALKVLGTGAVPTLTINQAAPTSLQVKKRYVLGCWIKGDASTSAGSLVIKFTGTGYTEGSTEKIELNTTALQSTTWTHYKCFVNIPANIPSDFKIAISFTSSFNGTCYIDDLVLGVPTYHGGICYAVFEGQDKFINGDTFTLSVTNDDAGAFNKFFRKAFRFQCPTSSTPTRDNSLTT